MIDLMVVMIDMILLLKTQGLYKTPEFHKNCIGKFHMNQFSFVENTQKQKKNPVLQTEHRKIRKSTDTHHFFSSSFLKVTPIIGSTDTHFLRR